MSIIVVLLWLLVAPIWAADARLADGAGSFVFVDEQGNADGPLTVWYYRPKTFDRQGPVLFVIHGRNRNGEEYRDSWISHAERGKYLLLCPEFSLRHYPDYRKFNLGNMFDEDDRPREKALWSFSAIEHLFDQVVRDNSLEAKSYTIYGHSAGGQFVHRMAIFLPEARYHLAIAANPGWYTMPTHTVAFPYGLRSTGVDDEHLKKVLQRRLIVLLGTADSDPNDENLLKSDEALRQGPHRFARGQAFFQAGKRAASELGVECRWQLIEVPGVGHDNSKMAPAATKLVE